MKNSEYRTLLEIAWLEFPADEPARREWLAILRAAVRLNQLPATHQTTTRPAAYRSSFIRPSAEWTARTGAAPLATVAVTTARIHRRAYRTWRATMDVPKTAISGIHGWLAEASDKEILERLKAGQSAAAIEKETGASRRRIHRLREKAKIPPHQPGPKAK